LNTGLYFYVEPFTEAVKVAQVSIPLNTGLYFYALEISCKQRVDGLNPFEYRALFLLFNMIDKFVSFAVSIPLNTGLYFYGEIDGHEQFLSRLNPFEYRALFLPR